MIRPPTAGERLFAVPRMEQYKCSFLSCGVCVNVTILTEFARVNF